MIWGFFFLAVLLFAQLGTPSGNNRTYKLFQILLIITLSSMAGFGGIASQDHAEYVRIYNETKDVSLFSFFSEVTLRDYSFKTVKYIYEIGYIFLNIISHKLALGEAGFFFFVSLLTNTFIVKTIYRFKYPIISVLVFVTSRAYLQEVNLVRQTLAISMLAYSLKYIETGNFKKFFTFIFLSATIHTSSFYCVVLYIIRFFYSPTRKKLLIYGLSFIWVLSMFSIKFGSFIGLDFINAYTTYGALLEESEMAMGQIHFDYESNIIVAFLLFTSLFWHKRKISTMQIDVYFVCIILAAVFSNISITVFYFFRISLIFTAISCLSIATKFSEIKFLNLSKYSLPLLLLVILRLYVATSIVVTNSEVMGSEFYSLDKFFSF